MMKLESIVATLDVRLKGEPYKMKIEFTVIPPVFTTYVGNGCFLKVAQKDGTEYVDIRFSDTIDLETLTDRWIKEHFGYVDQLVKEFKNRK